MQDIKIIFFDIDGTLISLDKNDISAKTRKALSALKEKGIILVIASGRSPIQLPHFEGIDFDSFLTFNGSLCYNDKEQIFSNSLNRADVLKLIENAKAMDKPLGLASIDRYVADYLNDDLEEYFSFGSTMPDIVDDIGEFVRENDIYQMVMPIKKEEYETALAGTDKLKITAWWDMAVDIVPHDGGKGRSVEKILNYYGFDKNEALAFGDGDNDIEMFEQVRGIAMENASENLKNISFETCKSVDADGIYYYLKDKGII